MKRIEVAESTIIVGTGRQIKSLYKAMVKHDFYTVFTDEPKFNMARTYGLVYSDDADSFESGIRVINADTIVQLMLDN